jgi:hypothetical protein|mmetsp:Transcript_30513/g.72550  ORF Transcript_30513/g.72550 Transcript_30513/m.72550 type:complete len:109 (-) Transcript_30513:223-549(-)|eukprot:CAMPEP_0180128820 /NCGR_PEP_ID=MMETSP0986-20121125/6982_1 /TAXON_ID=697907 /ORGANISM="non described non described, Strain CCMP2293" /LENGTH=108 /DNA_ID=CAMNT_0022068439 /DNA_START=14 /DNA_END=340 /DNA_ORIENTATION=+
MTFHASLLLMSGTTGSSQPHPPRKWSRAEWLHALKGVGAGGRRVETAAVSDLVRGTAMSGWTVAAKVLGGGCTSHDRDREITEARGEKTVEVDETVGDAEVLAVSLFW